MTRSLKISLAKITFLNLLGARLAKRGAPVEEVAPVVEQLFHAVLSAAEEIKSFIDDQPESKESWPRNQHDNDVFDSTISFLAAATPNSFEDSTRASAG